MAQPAAYSFVADLLSKFHTASELVQVIWLLAPAATILGTAAIFARALRDIATPKRRSHGIRDGQVYIVYQEVDGRWMLYQHGCKPREIEWAKPLREGAREVIGMAGRPN